MIFDHENGNWKNSEIATELLSILERNAAQRADNSNVAVSIHEPANDNVQTVEAERELMNFHKTSASQLIINELGKVANSINADHAALLELELAIEDIKDILE